MFKNYLNFIVKWKRYSNLTLIVIVINYKLQSITCHKLQIIEIEITITHKSELAIVVVIDYLPIYDDYTTLVKILNN